MFLRRSTRFRGIQIRTGHTTLRTGLRFKSTLKDSQSGTVCYVLITLLGADG